MTKKTAIIALLLVLSVACTIYLRTVNDRDPDKPEKLTIGYLRIAASLPLFVASEEGLFEESGFDVDLVPFGSSNELALAGATGQVDIMASCAVNACVDAMITSETESCVFLVNQYRKNDANGRATDHLIVKKGTTFEDLNGKTVAFFPGSVSKVFAREIFGKHGIQIEDITYVEMAPPEWLPALKSGRIDAVNAVEPAATLILQNDEYESLIKGYFAEVQPDVPLSCFWFSPSCHENVREDVRNVFREALAIIERDSTKAVIHYQSFTDIPNKVYEKIGLNKWQLTFENPEARSSLDTLITHLSESGAVKGKPKSNWYE